MDLVQDADYGVLEDPFANTEYERQCKLAAQRAREKDFAYNQKRYLAYVKRRDESLLHKMNWYLETTGEIPKCYNGFKKYMKQRAKIEEFAEQCRAKREKAQNAKKNLPIEDVIPDVD